MDKFRIADLGVKGAGIALGFAKNEGWNPGLHDQDSLFKADPNGFFIGLLGDEPIACISAVAYDNSFGFIGLYIVRPDFRGQGFGLKIWNRAIDYLATQNIGLDAVKEQQANYMRSGFSIAYSNIRFKYNGKKTIISPNGYKKLDQVPFNILASYDDMMFPAKRHGFLKNWIAQPESHAIGFLENDKLKGYGVIRRCYDGYKLGPLFADTKDIADNLFLSLCNYADKEAGIFMDVPANNSLALEIAAKHRMEKVFETARMYTKNIPVLPYDKIYGATTLEIG